MAATQIRDFLQGEDLVAIDPEIRQRVEAYWLQRLSLFTGRTLSDTALKNEQAYRAGRLNLLGQAVTQGTVTGLELSFDAKPTDPELSLSPGYGIAASGQDVALTRPVSTTLSGLAVLNGDTGDFIADFSKFTAPAQAWAAIFLLQPVIAEVSGSAVNTGSANLIVSGNLAASCDQDPTEDAFDDSQRVDAARLVLVTWPSHPALALPSAANATTWRNRLAYTVFNAELGLKSDDYLPWEFLGVPLALAGFDSSSKLLFADRSAVVRFGGLPRRRYLRVLPDRLSAVQPALASARINQFAEQLGADLTPASLPALVPNEFVFLPPAGVLPAYTMDFPNKKALWCPSDWTVTAAPVLAEELESAIQASMTAAPLEVAQEETIQVLVPLPDAVFDPNILVHEEPSPEFQKEVDAATLSRNIVLQHWFVIQQEANALAPLLNQPQVDPKAGLTDDEAAAMIGPPAVFSPLQSEAFGTTLTGGKYVSDDLQLLLKTATTELYVITAGGKTIPFFKDAELQDLANIGIQHFIDRVQARLNQADDLLDLAFLTGQTDIYRYRQNVLNTSAAGRLAVSTILANIASGDTAAATAQNIREYLSSVKAPSSGTTTTTTTTTTPGPNFRARAAVQNVNPTGRPTFLNTARTSAAQRVPIEELPTTTTAASTAATSAARQTVTKAGVTANLRLPGVDSPATPIDITQQAPIVGAELNLRTMTIAERLAPSAAQEAMFYSVGNRVSVLLLLADLDLTIDDLPILVDTLPSDVPPFVVADLKVADRKSQLFKLVNTPSIPNPSNTTPDESALFSTGVHVVEQNTQLLRAIEGRIQQYRDFLALAAAALSRVQTDFSQAQALLTRLGNDLSQARQELAFVQTLLNDELTRVANVNAQRTAVLQQYVSYVAYVRPRTLVTGHEVPSRQLVPAAVSSPVPACTTQSAAIPPELREIVSLLREAPVRWFPPIVLQLPKLERPVLVQSLAASTHARASVALKSSVSASSAESAAGRFAAPISTIFSANQQVVRNLQSQRASFDPATLVNQSWSAQLDIISEVAAVGDLLSSAVVHPEITNSVSRTLQQISSVATCLYTRVGQALPADRLEWANFLLDGVPSLRNLAVLPGWNTQNYIDRQQMQLLADWLYQQIDNRAATAVAVMNDVIATAILLASHAPVDDIIAGAVALRTPPIVGGMIRLTLPSDRVAHGMSVQLYSGKTLAARAVVTDLDGGGVTATITDVYKPGATLEANDVAHFTGLDQNAVVHRAFTK
jgi:hypothetical protein